MKRGWITSFLTSFWLFLESVGLRGERFAQHPLAASDGERNELRSWPSRWPNPGPAVPFSSPSLGRGVRGGSATLQEEPPKKLGLGRACRGARGGLPLRHLQEERLALSLGPFFG